VDLQGITREQKEMGAAVAMLLFIISLFLKWQSFGPISGSGADLGSWPLVLIIALVAGGIVAADGLRMDIPLRRMNPTSVATYLMSLLVFYVVVFIFAIDGLSYGVWLALIFSVVGLVLTFSVYREDTR
jgi:O-antigen/teichoic acid export membrane protein